VHELLEALEQGWGLEVVLWIQSWRTPFLFDAAFTLSLTGEVVGFVLIWSIIYWCMDARLGRRLGVTYFLVAWLNQSLKEWWQRPRPFQVSPEVDWPYPSDSFGLPSGHASLTVTGWGVIALWIRRRWATFAIVVYIVLVVLTRLVLGVHYPQDVIVGSTIGLIALVLYRRLEPRMTRWLPSQPTPRLIGMITAVAAVLVLVHPLVISGVPEHRPEAAGVVGIFLGLTVGFVIETRTVGFRAAGEWWKRIVRAVLGWVVMIGLIAIFHEVPAAAKPFLSLPMAAVVALWASLGAPWMFLRIGLASSEDAPRRGSIGG
jgi:membrane-associated phospholipid phosphatase